MKVIFLDIDGVLFSGRAAILPANDGLVNLTVQERMRRVAFDAAAVELINRVAWRTGAKIVVHSEWRKVIGVEATLERLLQQGLDPVHLHDDWHTPAFRFDNKAGEIQSWLKSHRLTAAPVWPEPGDPDGPYPLPDEPSEQAAIQGQIEAYHAAVADHGIDYVVIDDMRLIQIENRQIVVDQDEGFSIADYRVALGMLGAVEPAMGVYAVSPADWAMVLAAHDAAAEWGPYPQIAAASAWLHLTSARNDPWTRARRLNAEEVIHEFKQLPAYGYTKADLDGRVERQRQSALADLPPPAPKETA